MKVLILLYAYLYLVTCNCIDNDKSSCFKDKSCAWCFSPSEQGKCVNYDWCTNTSTPSCKGYISESFTCLRDSSKILILTNLIISMSAISGYLIVYCRLPYSLFRVKILITSIFYSIIFIIISIYYYLNSSSSFIIFCFHLVMIILQFAGFVIWISTMICSENVSENTYSQLGD